MATHQNDLEVCYNLVSSSQGKVCDKCDGQCVSCGSMNNMVVPVKICEPCYTSNRFDCILCGAKNNAKNSSYYCYQCYINETHKDGCPRITNIGSTQIDKYYQKKAIEQSKSQKNTKP